MIARHGVYTATECRDPLRPEQPKNTRYCEACLAKPAIAEAERERVRVRMRQALQRSIARKGAKTAAGGYKT